VRAFAPDLVLLAGFMRILTPVFVQPLRGRLLNIHPSLLPKYPGLDTHQRAIDAGDAEAGATVHFVTEDLDGGPPIVQVRVPVQQGDDAAALAQRTLAQEHRIYPLAARWFAQGRLSLSDHHACLDGRPLPPTGCDFQEGMS
jgi:phosphoribosylglycinamide formyltransferase-1